ncbi:MlaD family protein [Candidatus Omnitrophota bacterium]
MSKTLTNDIKTGFLVLICLTILITLTLSVNKLDIFNKQYEIKAIFGKVAGVGSDAPVRLSGVEVGKIDEVKLLYNKEGETKILVKMSLDPEAKLREGATACVTMLGLMGEKYIELTPGEKGAPYVKSGHTITGKDPMQMEEIVDIAKEIADEIKTAMRNISSLAMHLDETVVDNRPDIDEIVGNLKRTTSNFEEFSADIKENPWKLLTKGKDTKKETSSSKRNRSSSRY